MKAEQRRYLIERFKDNPIISPIKTYREIKVEDDLSCNTALVDTTDGTIWPQEDVEDHEVDDTLIDLLLEDLGNLENEIIRLTATREVVRNFKISKEGSND